jgi:hypothetical protein
MIVTDLNLDSGIYYSVSPEAAGFTMNPHLFDLGAAANIGLQVMVSTKTLGELPSVSFTASGASGSFGLDVTFSSITGTYGFGAGSRAGAGGGAGFAGVIPFCRD